MKYAKSLIFVFLLSTFCLAFKTVPDAPERGYAYEYLSIIQQMFAEEMTWFSYLKGKVFSAIPQLRSAGPNYNKFTFIPDFRAYVKPGETINDQAPCFAQTSYSLAKNSDGSYTFTMKVEKAKSLTCSDFYLVAYHGNYWIPEHFFSGSHT